MVPGDGKIRRVKTTKAREEFGSLVDCVAYSKRPVLLERRGKALAVLVPMEDYQLLVKLIEDWEDRDDIRVSRQRLKDGNFIPWEQVRKELGLDSVDARIHPARPKRIAAVAAGHTKAHRRTIVATVAKSEGGAGRKKNRGGQ